MIKKNKRETEDEGVRMKKIGLVLFGIILWISALIIGSPIKYNATWLNGVIMIIGILYVIVRKWKDRNYTIIRNKMDIWILAFCIILPLLPIVFHTVASLNDAVTYVYKYASAFVIYWLTRDICLDNKENKKYIVNTIILTGVFLCLLGIDNMTTNVMGDFLKSLNLVNVINIEGRMFSTFGYANSFAIYIAVCLVLAIGYCGKTEKQKRKAMYGSAVFLFFSCIILSYSKATLLLLAIAIVAVLFLSKDRNKRIETIALCITEGVLAILYVMFWTKLLNAKDFLALWIVTILFILIAYGVSWVMNKLQSKLQKVNTKTYYIIAFAAIVAIFIFILVGLQFTKPLVLFHTKNSVQEVKYKVTKVEPNKEYQFVFEVDAISKLKNKKEYTIEIVEENKYYDEIQSTQIDFNTFKGKKEIVIHTLPETVEIAIYIKCNYKIAKEKLVIQSLHINGEEYVLQYAYLPVSLVNKIKDINLNTKSAWERMVFYQDAVKLIQNHPMIGMGGNAWVHTYQKVQQYSYHAKEVHSYVIQILLEYGILGLIALLGIVGCIIRIAYLQKKSGKDMKSFSIVLVAIMLLLIHSAIDFDMSFLCHMFLFFTLLGIIRAKDDNCIKRKTVDNFIGIGVILLFSLYSWYIMQEVGIGPTLKREMPIQKIEQMIAKVPYKREYREKRIQYYEKQEENSELLLQAIEDLIETEPNIEKIVYWNKLDYSKLTRQQTENIMKQVIQQGLRIDPVYNKVRSELLLQILNQTKEQDIVHVIKDTILTENEKIIENIKNQEINRLTKKQIDILLEDQNSKIEQIENKEGV